MGFWIAAAAMATGIALLLILALRRVHGGADSSATFDLQVYRDQLKEVERDLARGVISPEDADRLRAEVSRRILDADRAMKAEAAVAGPASTPYTLVISVLIAALLGGSLWLYWRIGAPLYPDMPLKERIAAATEARENRPSQAEAEAQAAALMPEIEIDPEFAPLMEQLRATVAERPFDLQGQELLARNEATLGNFRAAADAQARIIQLKAPAERADDYVSHAEFLILAAGGYVSPEAESQLTEALKRDPKSGAARYYSGLLFAQTGRPDLAFRLWSTLLAESPPTAPWVAPIRAQIEDIAWRAGVRYTLPPEGMIPGPTAEEAEAAGDMSPEDQQQMIRAMVEGLNARLASTGGTAEEWAQLISSLAVLGEMEQARAVWAEAQSVFVGRALDLAILRRAAVAAKVAQ